MLPPRVQSILATRVVSHEALQALLLMHRESQREWRPAELAAALNLHVGLAEGALEVLAAGGLVRQVASVGGASFRYAPVDSADEGLVTELRRIWEEQPLEIIRLMNANAISRTRSDALRAFSDAFLLSKRRSDD
jgi:hypothetical protein